MADQIESFFRLRAEQYDDDSSKWFVEPPFNIKVLNSGLHPVKLVGGRGSGKTMLLRAIAEAPYGKTILDEMPEPRLRVYIRPDNQLANSYTGWNIEREVWNSAFVEMILLRILKETIGKFNHILTENKCKQLCINEEGFSFSTEGIDAEDWVRLKLHKLHLWVRTPSKHPPIVIGYIESLDGIINSVFQKFPQIPKRKSVSVFIDELESYRPEQQILINDWIKNPPNCWVFHIACRPYLDQVLATSGKEHIEETHDFFTINIDEHLSGTSQDDKARRELFYAKIIEREISNISGTEIWWEDPVSLAKSVLPKPDLAEVCKNIFENSVGREAFGRLIKRSLRNRPDLDFVNFSEKIDSIEDKRWKVLLPLTIERGNESIIGNTNEKEAKQFLDNYLYGMIFQTYLESNGRLPTLSYTGYSRLCAIVLSNVREFMLIIREAFMYELSNRRHQSNKIIKSKFLHSVKLGASPHSQAKSLKNRSGHFTRFVSISAEKRGFGIRQLLENWIYYFSRYQQLPGLPYNEPNHIVSTDNNISEKTELIINASMRHGALIKDIPTKLKNDRKIGQTVYKLHPLICVDHCLSFRNKNAPQMPGKEVDTISNAQTQKDLDDFLKSKNTAFSYTTQQDIFRSE